MFMMSLCCELRQQENIPPALAYLSLLVILVVQGHPPHRCRVGSTGARTQTHSWGPASAVSCVTLGVESPPKLCCLVPVILTLV